jgi:serine/threonine-protein kinase SRPK3
MGARQYVTIKINVNTLGEDHIKGRRAIASRLANGNPNHPGYNHVRFTLDTFTLKHGKSSHLCIVYNVLREPLIPCMKKLPGQLFSSRTLRLLVPALLKGLDYMHSECRVVHTDLKPDNVMMGLGDASVLDKVVRNEHEHPSARKAPDHHGRVIYVSRDDFGAAPTDAVIASAKITDIGLAVWGDEPHNHPIQSNAFTAPEVILAANWSYPADIWNLGVMLWDLFEDFGIFDSIDTIKHYNCNKHLGLMIALLGPPPKELLERGSTSATYFDMDTGEYRNPSFIPEDLSFETAIKRIKGSDKELFIDFIKKMLCWLPEERWTAKQLLTHPWLIERTGEEMRSDYEKVDDAAEHMAVLSCSETKSTVPDHSCPTSPVNGKAASEDGHSMGTGPLEPPKFPGIKRAQTNEISSGVIDSILARKR